MCESVKFLSEGQVENRAKFRKISIFPGFKQKIFPVCPWYIRTLRFTPFLTKFTPSNLRKRQGSSKNGIFGQILNSSLIFDLLPLAILGLSSNFCYTPLSSQCRSWINQTLVFKTYFYPKLWKKNLWGVGSTPPPPPPLPLA